MQEKYIFGAHLGKNLKYLRKQMAITQEDMSEKLSLKKSTYASYEASDGNTPPVATLYQIAKIFNVTMESLLNLNYSILGNQKPIKITETETYFPVSVDLAGQELIDIVPSTYQAQAGYLTEFSDPSFIQSLPKAAWDFGTYIPGTKRIFQINGDSMLPIPSQSYILSVRSDLHDLIRDYPYIVITDHDILFKRISPNSEGTLHLVSDNPLYPTQSIHLNEVRQMWKAIKVISDLPDKPSSSIDQLNKTIQDTNEKVTALADRWAKPS
ncbi:MAG: LexA family transcriptional regulator [Saprospiraceae bacterium]|nr:LexA family transcriptional regulator [Saprospiraceae bacterium]